ncbi:TonB-dependent receptor domain-containing protein [Sphingomonas lycopersici]|uniref:TonB-dependent receptor n=1 Tax=Sphingomonas lycopersici TaxID=2951807 RepID=A0AA42CR57_9SPHN|nr:TonB-dependent receptor [Sphingomonas lycopersici]MCW6535969.1 TonB-dependent receptor [Sphingomonas lycopersici]
MCFDTRARRAFLTSACLVAVLSAAPAVAQVKSFNLEVQPAGAGIAAFARQANVQVLISDRDAKGRHTNALKGTMSVEVGLVRLLAGSGLHFRKNDTGTFVVVTEGSRPMSSDAATDGAIAQQAPVPGSQGPDSGQDVIVTAQKVREKVQDVPIAISVFTAKVLNDQKIEGGSELLRGTPNVSFSKTNFASYNFQIRGIGTQALSVTTDPAVAVSFNSMPLVRNRLFEQEYFDVDRVEVLRGPQGTLYGRNATAGVVNMIPKLADPAGLDGDLRLEGGNYGSMRASGMLNLPLGDSLAIRVAGAWTRRDGYDFNTVTNRAVNGRDLWSTRGSIVWKPDNRFTASLVWEHFNEDDNRSRTGKQLCHNDPSPTAIGDTAISAPDRGFFSQGCRPGSLYEDGAFGVPNGASLPNVVAATIGQSVVGYLADKDGNLLNVVPAIAFGSDPFSNVVQSRNLREIATTYDPRFRAKNDVVQFNAELNINDSLKLVSQTGWSRDNYFSTQDYNRFVSRPVFFDTSQTTVGDAIFVPTQNILPGGAFCDPQLGCSKGILAVDINRSKSRQISQEFRLQSQNSGPINFNFGVNYLDFKIDEDYYVFNNTFTLVGEMLYNNVYNGDHYEIVNCPRGLTTVPGDALAACLYVDPNPLGSINGEGHNYFRSRNVARTRSWAGFGEIYWKATDTLKITAGLRYTRDIKVTTPYPSQLLLTPGLLGGGYVNSGYPAQPDIKQRWGAVTGRFVVDWKPHLSFTNETLIYASYARGYKAGGTNSPSIGSDPQYLGHFEVDPRFRPEYVNAFEIGTKNTFAGGRLTLNATAFFYDYKDYQVSQIVDRATKNENFNAISYGLELESIWRPTPRWRFNANLGLLKTRIGNGMKSIDVMNRLQGHDDWVMVKPWLQQASNCIAPKAKVQELLNMLADFNAGQPPSVDAVITGFCAFSGVQFGGPALYGIDYDPLTYADVGQNQGRGFYADLSGKELPNAPHWTFNIGGQYTLPIASWNLTLRGDYYAQGASWARVYNAVNDRLRGWDNLNLAITLDRPASGFAVQLYIKNVFDKAPITGAFVNSDDSGLTTNVFTLDPRIIGLSLSKRF